VLVGVLVLRRIATAHLTTGHAHPQVHPRVPEGDALLASLRAAPDVLYLVGMTTLSARAQQLLGG